MQRKRLNEEIIVEDGPGYVAPIPPLLPKKIKREKTDEAFEVIQRELQLQKQQITQLTQKVSNLEKKLGEQKEINAQSSLKIHSQEKEITAFRAQTVFLKMQLDSTNQIQQVFANVLKTHENGLHCLLDAIKPNPSTSPIQNNQPISTDTASAMKSNQPSGYVQNSLHPPQRRSNQQEIPINSARTQSMNKK